MCFWSVEEGATDSDRKGKLARPGELQEREGNVCA